ncbi:aminoglycoside phosphotransferase family protein [Nocardioides sp.]|uniref:aminoglycoside phosphotransferase family protein n=1 Tax=Nocardioides sp. TaxID=35761 RepID=UPI0025E5EF7B|nr:aminoglycoside phosphotransferase family protein [Nocardioides sp.]
MSVRRADLGEPLAVGRSAEILSWPGDADRVIKLFPATYDAGLVAAEVVASTEAHRLGLTTIACHGQVQVEDRPGLLLDRLHGDSLTRLAERNPLTLRSGARTLARTHARVHEAATSALPEIRDAADTALDTPPLAFLTEGQRELAREAIRSLPAGDRVLHLDFHTENVFAHDGGHAVIDWQTALRGDPAADVAMTVLLLSDAELWPGTPLLKRILVQSVRRLVLSTYLAEYRSVTGMTSEQIAAWRLPAVVLRMSTLDIASERPAFVRELTAMLGAAR